MVLHKPDKTSTW